MYICIKYLKYSVMKSNLIYHHSSLCRGYLRKDCGFEQPYSGRFGFGFIKHIPNCNRKVSNNYHWIDYYIYG